MAHNAIQISDGLIEIERDGDRQIAVDTGIPLNSPTLRKLAGQKRRSGWIVHSGRIDEWTPKGFVEHAGRVHVFGPLSPGKLASTVLESGGMERLLAVKRLADTYDSLLKAGIELQPVHIRSIILLDDGGTLILPPDITQAIRDHQNYAQRIAGMERYNHPDRTVAQNVGFSLAAAAYYIITGSYAYDADDEEELHARIRSSAMIPAAVRDVTIRADVSDALHEALAGPESTVDAAAWSKRLAEWHRTGVHERLTDEQRVNRQTAASQTIQKVEKGFRRRESVRRNGRLALIIAIVTIVVGTIPGTIIYNALQPRSTAGLPADEVVRVFYTSINSLDHMTMEDAVIDKAGQPLIREVTNLFVIDRQRMSVEMQSGFVDAQQWRDLGMPALDAGRLPYGVANLSLTATASPDEERWYTAEYERWIPDYEAAESGRSPIAGVENREIVRLRLDRDDWVIYEFEEISTEPIDVRELRRALQPAG